MTDVGTTGGTKSHWLRLRVENAKGKRSADDVEVLVVDVRARAQGRGQTFGGAAVVWSNMNVGGEYVTRLTLPPGVPRYVDLLALVEPRPQTPAETPAKAQLQVWPAPADGRHELGVATYDIVLAVSARDSNAAFYEVQVEHDGKWWPADAVKGHLKVVSLKRRRRGT